ncbi:dUTP diphosphatase [Microvirga sp. W0021]|uniref:Deoxyuridine 5'-triphosphate nucleotidohydrolase n=1 Tax=Hohaiivirga grylli TaxID=3133970 RepID=A0ABV0BFD3_9HYPH
MSSQSFQELQIRVVRLPHAEGLELPRRETEHAAGLDLVAANPEAEPLVLKPRARALVPTGLVMEIPPGFEGQVRPRSGLAFKHGITVANAPGTIDADYRGEVKVLLINLGEEDFVVTRGMRVAQLLIAPVSFVSLVPVETVETTSRGAGGFGSTGL